MVGAALWSQDILSSSSLAAAPARVTSLRVTEVQRDSVTLTWTPVPGASSYILSWSPPAGEMGGWPQDGRQCSHGHSPSPLTLSPGWQPVGRRGGRCLVLPAPSKSPGCAWASATPSPSARSWGARRVLRSPSASAQVRWGHYKDRPGLSLLRWQIHPFPAPQSAGMPVVTSSSWCMAPATAPLVLMPPAPSSPTPCPPWGAWALRAPR